MLRVLINDKSEDVLKLMNEYEEFVSDYFDDVYEDEWFEDKYVIKLINEIDETEVKPDGTLYNKYLGSIVKQQLSTGVKSLILLYKTDCKIRGERLGDNCWRYVVDISTLKDIDISLRHIPVLPDDFSAYLINTNKIINKREYIESFINMVD